MKGKRRNYNGDDSVVLNVDQGKTHEVMEELGRLINFLEGDRVGLIAFAGSAHLHCPLTEDYSAAKLFFAYGLGNAMTFPLWVGGEAILFSAPPTPGDMHEIVEKYKPTIYYGVPTLYAAQLKLLENTEVDLSSIRLCISAGEALPPDLLKRWREKTSLPLLDGIGTTEILHISISILWQ